MQTREEKRTFLNVVDELRKQSKCLALAGFVSMAFALGSSVAGASLAVTATKLTDGTGTCTLDPTTVVNGNLCTNDEARYNIAYSVNPPPADQSNVVLELTIPAAEPFRFTKGSPGLAACINQSTAVSADGKTISCQLKGLAPNPVNGPIGNQAADIVFDLLTTKAAKNGDTLAGVTAKITSAENPTGAISVAPGVTVVAQPQLNLYKKLNSVQFAVGKPAGCTSAGTNGILVTFQMGLDLANVKGHEALANGWTYTDNVAGLHPNACLYDVLNYTQITGVPIWPPVGPNNPDSLNTGGGLYTYTPGAGGVATITASSIDPPNTSGDVVGQTNGFLKVTALHYIRIWVADADAATSTAGDPCTFSGSNTVGNFDPNGLSGASNLGAATETLTDNTAVVGPYPLCSGSGEKLFTSNTKGASKSIFQGPPRMSNEVSGPNDFVDTYTYWSNSGFQPRSHSHCDKWDNRKLQLDNLDPAVHASDYAPVNLGASSYYLYKSIPVSGAMVVDPTSGFAHIWRDSPGLTRGPTNTTGELEFGFVGGGTYTDQQLRAATCNNADSTLATAATAGPAPASATAIAAIGASGWITQSALLANPSLVPFVNAMRSLDVVIPPGQNFQIFTHLKTLSANPFTSTVWPDGTILPNYWSVQTNATGYVGVAPGTTNWYSTPNGHMGNDPLAVPNTANFCDAAQQLATPGAYCDDGFSDRLRLATESVGVRKGIAGFDPNGGPLSDSPVVPKSKGDIVTYQLWPVLTAKSANVTINNDVILVDTLPAGMKYVAASAKYNGVPIAPADIYVLDNAPAPSTIKFIVRNVVASSINSAIIPPLEFDAEVVLDDPLNVANRVLTNKVVIQACAPGAALSGAGAETCNVQTASQTLAERTAVRTIQLAPTGALLVQKSVIGGSSKEIRSSFTMGLRYLNAGSAAVAEHRLIDVLPYVGEPNRGFPSLAGDATKFSGTRPLASVTTAAASDQVFYTTAAPGTIDLSPKCESNSGIGPGPWPAFAPGVPPTAGCAGAAGATTWTAATGPGPTFTGFPAGTTAILIVDKNNFAAGAPSRLATMTFSTPGSIDKDRYSNNVVAANGGPGTSATAPGDGATFSTFSNNVTVRVFASSIQGTVFVDPNANGGTTGFLPAEDTGLGGQTVTLKKGATTVGTAVTATAAIPAGQFYNPATGAAEATASATNCPVPAAGLPLGGYLFCNLVAGSDYELVETQPTSYTTTGNKAGNATTPGTVGPAANTITGIGLGANQQAAGYDFGEAATTFVAGRVYVEKSGNTLDDGNAIDTGLNGVSISLTYTPPNGGAPVTVTTTTDPTGNYRFDNIPAGSTNATISETQPVAYASAYTTPGTSGSAGANLNELKIATIPAGGSPNNNFAESLGSISGKVYELTTNAPFVGQTITLTGNDVSGNPVTRTTTTDGSGNYAFTDLPLSNGAGYTVLQPAQPPATLNVLPIAGDNGGTPTNPATGTPTSQIAGIVLTAVDAVANGNNFPETAVTSVSGRVYVEKNGNTTDDGNATDSGIGGVTITLTFTPPGGGAAVTVTTTTNPDGTYSFANIPVGATNAVITETQPAAYASAYNSPGTGGTQGNNSTTLSIGTIPATGSPLNNFAETLGTVAGKVYNQGTNAGFPGETVTLTGTDAAGNPVSLTTTTKPDGTYEFKDVPMSGPGGYVINQPNQPAGSTNQAPIAGSTGGTATNPTSTSSRIAAVQVSPTTPNSTGNNFPETVGTTVSGLVYIDKDNNGTLQPTDTGRIGGVTVTLYAANGTTVLATKQTNPDGTYAFTAADGVTEGGNYIIRETQPTNYGDRGTNPGAGNTTTAPNDIIVTNVPLAGSPNNNFGEVAGTVAGKVYNVGTNVGYPGETVTLTGTDAAGKPVSLTTTTLPDGTYVFNDVPLSNAAGYTVTQPNQPAGSTNVTPLPGSTGGTAANPSATSSTLTGVRVSGNTPATLNSVNNNFPESVGTTISGLVYVDTDRSGSLTAADPARIGGVTVQLLAADGVTVLATKQTAADGTYSFGPADGVTEGGTFFVRETQPAAYGDSATNPGTAGTTPSANLIRIANVPAAGSPNNNFGELAGSVAGNVTNSTTSTPIPGQTITLTGTDAAGNPVSLTTTTLPNGSYTFPNVPLSGPNGYTVTQPNQPPGTSNGATTAGTTGGTATPATTATSAITGVRVSGTTPATLDSANNNFAENSIIDLSTSTSAVKNADGTGTFTVATTNVGTQPAPNVRMTTQLPPGLTGVVVSNGGTYNPTTGLVTWPSIPNIAPGANVQYTVTVPLPSGAVVTAQTTASSFETPTSTTPLAEATLANNPSNATLQEAPKGIPTLSAFMLGLMALMMAGFAGLRRRK
jgi:SdrD B-like domain/Domain of unknown function DUF11